MKINSWIEIPERLFLFEGGWTVETAFHSCRAGDDNQGTTMDAQRCYQNV